MDAVITITNPTRALVFVAGTAAVAMGVAAARLAKQLRAPEPPTAAAAAAYMPPVQDSEVDLEVLTDLSVIAGKVSVEIQRDGSVILTGIPDTVPEDLGQVVAEIALDAAMRQVRRTLPVQPNPSRDDPGCSPRQQATRSEPKHNTVRGTQPDDVEWPARVRAGHSTSSSGTRRRGNYSGPSSAGEYHNGLTRSTEGIRFELPWGGKVTPSWSLVTWPARPVWARRGRSSIANETTS